jgi:hypothetical protein
MNDLLFDSATFTVGADSLVEGTILLSISFNLDFSYVDAVSCVVFIFDTTRNLPSSGVVCNPSDCT